MLKYSAFLFLFSLLIACESKSAKPSSEKVDPKLKVTKEKVEKTTRIETETAIKNVDWNYYAGTVGLYDSDVLMELQITDSTVNGGYWYVKQGKRLSLKGKFDQKKQVYIISEYFQGMQSGTFELKKENSFLTGTWTSAKDGSEPENVALSILIQDLKSPLQPKFEKYTFSHEIEVYNTEEADIEQVHDDLLCTRIGGYLIFIYDVIGHNYHSGHLSGIAQFESDNRAVFSDGEDCDMQFKFGSENVDIVPEGCDEYHGARAFFGGILKQK